MMEYTVNYNTEMELTRVSATAEKVAHDFAEFLLHESLTKTRSAHCTFGRIYTKDSV